jgi:hypothetical protein
MAADDRPLRTYRPDSGIEYRYNPAIGEIEWRDTADDENAWVISTFDTTVVRRLAKLIENPYEP